MSTLSEIKDQIKSFLKGQHKSPYIEAAAAITKFTGEHIYAQRHTDEEDRIFFKEEYENVSLEEKFERGLIDEATYDKEFELRALREKGITN